jgi:hypothetical protein
MCAFEQTNFGKTESALSRRGHRRNAIGSAHPIAKLSPWQAERTRRVLRILRCIKARVERGQSLKRAVTYFAWYHRGAVYKCDPSRRLRLSRKTIVRLYCAWQNSGYSAAVLAYKYRSTRSQLTKAKLKAFVRACLEPRTMTYAAAFGLLGDTSVTISCYQKGLPGHVKASLRPLFKLRRQTERARLAALRVERNMRP